jgi:hypothetical protein
MARSLVDNAVRIAIAPATTKASADAGPANAAAPPGNTKIPAPTIVPTPIINAAFDPSVRSIWVSVSLVINPINNCLV